MKRNSKSVVSVIAAAVIALLAAGCVTVPGESEDHERPTCRSTVGRVRNK